MSDGLGIRSPKAWLNELKLLRFSAKSGVLTKNYYRRRCSEAIVTWLSKDYFRYRDASSALARYRNGVQSPYANDSGALSNFPNYSAAVDGEADCALADLSAAGEPSGIYHLEVKLYRITRRVLSCRRFCSLFYVIRR